MELDKDELEKLARQNITDCLINLGQHKEAIELLTLTKGYKGILKLKDKDWVKLSKMNIGMRKPFEKVIQQERTLDLVKLEFGE